MLSSTSGCLLKRLTNSKQVLYLWLLFSIRNVGVRSTPAGAVTLSYRGFVGRVTDVAVQVFDAELTAT